MLAPVGYRVPIRDLITAALRATASGRHREQFQREIADHFSVTTTLAVSSGKAALTLALLALKRLSSRKKVIIPAYTCYSVPSSIVKAGLEVVPCDLAPDSFDYDYGQLQGLLGPDILCVVSVHLLGIPSDTARVKDLCGPNGIFVVDDAAQAMSASGKARPGTRGDVGILSLGRGKSVTCGAGGLVLTNSKQIGDALVEVTQNIPQPTFVDDAMTFITLLGLGHFIPPALYWLPAGLPFLRLGETIFHEEFPIRWLSNYQALLLSGWRDRLESLEAVRRRNAAHYAAHIAGERTEARTIACLRFPIVLRDADDKRRMLIEQDGVALGMSGLYPDIVPAIAQLKSPHSATDFPEARRMARSLITLPTHPLVTERDRTRICAAVNALGQGGRSIAPFTQPRSHGSI